MIKFKLTTQKFGNFPLNVSGPQKQLNLMITLDLDLATRVLQGGKNKHLKVEMGREGGRMSWSEDHFGGLHQKFPPIALWQFDFF